MQKLPKIYALSLYLHKSEGDIAMTENQYKIS